jgi:hypothetical protein
MVMIMLFSAAKGAKVLGDIFFESEKVAHQF